MIPPFEDGSTQRVSYYQENRPAVEGPWKAPIGHPLPPLPDGVVGWLGALGQGHLVWFLGQPGAPLDTVKHVRLSQHPFSWKERVGNMKSYMSLRFLEKIT